MQIEKAIQLAAASHTGQKDKGGSPYIFHPLRVMLRLKGEEAQILGILHDVLEDTQLTVSDLRREGLSDSLIRTLLHLTKNNNEDYDSFIDRVLENPLAVEVKLADIEDNLDISRIPIPSSEDFLRIEKYKRAKQKLEARKF